MPLYLARGIAADFAADLAKVGELRIIAGPPLTGSALAAPQPGARYLVTGRLQRAGERRRLTRRDMRNLATYDRFLRGQALLIVRRSEKNEQAKQRYRGTIELDPQFTRSYAGAYALMGVIHTWNGEPSTGIPLLRTALRLNPQASHLYFQAIGKAYLFAGDTELAVINLKEAILRNPVDLESRVLLAAIGERDSAVWEAEEVRALEAAFSTRQWVETNPMADRDQRQKIADLLAGVGLR